ncbi:Eco57I restriction-modification methylase domain-containing protein [Deinococcus marmoris]|uniref:Eco57I restriction-modification methylase domain-containing protein n=1 Tax=Deinococcus marmoris TaxID=249408 RepID=UPI00068FC648|nr:N-6 DNA methylase [Deinococcus marmoris]
MTPTQLTNVRVHGLGLTDDFLLNLSDRAQTAKVDGATPASYDLPPKVALEEAVLEAWDDARKAWARYQQHHTDAWSGWVRPLLKALDYAFPGGGAVGGRYAVSRLSETGDVPLHYAPPVVDAAGHAQPADLDRVTLHGTLRASPHGVMQGYLNATPEHLWGLVTNGEVLRVLRDNAQVTRPAYAEFNIGEMLRAEDARAFRVLWLLLHRSRLKGGKDSVLETWNAAASSEGIKARDSLRDGVKRAIEHLATGYLKGNPALYERVRSGELTPTTLYRACLNMVYQLVFLFVTEDRDLLFARDDQGDYVSDATTRERANYYLTRAMRSKAADLRGNPLHTDAHAGWERLLAHVRTGFPLLGLPALGSHLFQPNDLLGQQLDNRSFYEALRALSEITVDGARRPVNYAGLDSEELGSIYESLLELVPRIQPGPRFELQTLAGNERKTTGSYYTPTSLINLLLDSALDPVIDDAVNGKTRDDAIAALKNLKVIDPACGSGHFLIAAARRIGVKLAELDEETAQPSPAAQRRATRAVIAHCIYGADINPMAVELAKVALWLESQDAGKPLAFLDHRLRVGNSLLGSTPELMNAEDEIPEKVTKKSREAAQTASTLHLPDDAFVVLEGDDRPTVAALKKGNKAEREQAVRNTLGASSLFNMTEDLAPITAMVRALDKIEPENLNNVQAQESTWNAIQQSRQLQVKKLLADAWCAAFVLPKTPGMPSITTATLNAIKANPDAENLKSVREALRSAAEQYRFLHPHIEFPDVFGDERKGGFDCVLGNPPWERLKLQEKEWFAQRVPAIAEAPNAAARTRMITELKATHPKIHADFQADLRQAEGESHFIRGSGRYPLTGRGDVNTYAIFSELGRDSLNPGGRMGIIVPTGIATDDTTKFFFQSLMDNQTLHSLHDFQSGGGLFNEIGHARFKFCVLTASGGDVLKTAQFSFFSRSVAESLEPGRRFTISPNEIALMNPNTRTAPIFRSARDASITKSIYQRVPVLINEETGQNPWGIKFMAMFHMSADSGLFRTASQLEAEGWTLDGNHYTLEQEQMLPLYEAKLMHQFDHRFATYTPEGDTRDMTGEEKENPDCLPQAQYWMANKKVEDRLIQKDKDGNISWEWKRSWLMGFRDICRSTDERTFIFSLTPRTAVAHKMPLMFLDSSSNPDALISLFGSFIFDYVVRQKAGGTSMTYHYIKQFPILPPSAFTPTRLSFIAPRVLELTYTAHDLSGFAADLGYTDQPFTWNDERRFWLRAELDALYFILYGIARDDVAYIMDTFPIVRRKDETAHGGVYRTKEAILSVFDELERLGLERLGKYSSKVQGGNVAGGWTP